MDKEHEKQLSVSNSTSITASQIAASATSTRENRIMSGASPLAGKGWIVSGATVSGSSVLNHPPFLSQPVTGDLSLELGAPSWLTGFVIDQPSPVLEMGAGYPNQKGRAKITMLSQSSAPAESFWGKSEADVKAMMQEDPSKVFPELEFGHQELASADHYVADDPSLTSDRDFRNIPEPALEPFHASGEEDLRGDAFPNFREPQMENIPEMENSITSLHALPKSKVSEKVEDEDEVLVLTQTEMLYKVKGDVEPKPESVKRSKLTLTKASDGSSLLSFEEEERSPTAGKEAVRKSTLELKRMVEEKLEGSKKQDAEKELVSSLLDMLSGYGGFYDGQLQPSSLNELESSFPMPVPTWDFMSTGPDFALLVLNSSWNGLAKANVYQRGEPVYLKVTGQVPGQELYIHSCYAAPSPNPADKSRYALILNKGFMCTVVWSSPVLG
ncbi:hypothetical protein AOLI_G00128550 [Acnodon oligacanthus]